VAEVVLLRFYGGLSHEEIAEQLGGTSRVVERKWRFARTGQHTALRGP
jgi:DNA-directed RNA polymerase specialized sigma24 family protein